MALKSKKKIFIFDIDNTICKTEKNFYKKAKPINKVVSLINRLKKNGHIVKIYTSRYMGRTNQNVRFVNKKYKHNTEKQLKSWGLNYDKLIMGKERRSMVMSEEEKKLTAYHEAGHAIVGLKLPEHDPVYKVSIIPRGRALGVTMFLPEQDQYSHTKRYLKARIASLFGGRLAESMIFGEDMVTTGASNDIEQATKLARNMVTRWG